jgi:hypothetical protein
MKYTPVYKLPFIEATDQGRAYPTQSKTIAETLEAILLQTGNPPVDSDLASLVARLNAVEGALAASKTVRGTTLVNGTGGAVSQQAVQFPAGSFTEPPVVLQGSLVTSGGIIIGAAAINVSKDGFTIRLGTSSGGVPTGAHTINWVAVAR